MSNGIQERLELEKTTFVDLSFYPGEKGMNGVLVVKAPLTIEASKVLDCEERFYTINERPYADYQGRMTLKKVAKKCRVTIGDPAHPGAVSLLPDMIWKFSIGLEKDSKPSVQFRIHLDSQYRNVLVDMMNALNKDEFALEVVALQQNLFEDEPPTEGDGTRVDLSIKDKQMTLAEGVHTNGAAKDEDPDTGCTSCNNKLPMDPLDGKRHANGTPCSRIAAQEAIEGPGTLLSAREMAGGTTAAAKKARGGRKVPETPAPAAADIPDSEFPVV